MPNPCIVGGIGLTLFALTFFFSPSLLPLSSFPLSRTCWGFRSVKQRCAEIASEQALGPSRTSEVGWEVFTYDAHTEGKSHTELCPKIVILHKL